MFYPNQRIIQILSSFLIWTSYCCISFGQEISEHIHIDQFGYFENADKVAVISNPQIGYNSGNSYSPGNVMEVRQFYTDETVLTGTLISWNGGEVHSQSGDAGWWFDFSSLTEPGSYYIIDPTTGHQTGRFEINSNPYYGVAQASLKAFYYNRCNHSKELPFAEAGWTDATNFQEDFNARDAFDPNNQDKIRDMSGGWFDAGDYNKYVTFAHDPIHQLFSAYTENRDVFTDDWNIPESGDGIPDLLNEIKWELDWLRKMVNEDGSVQIKIGSVSFNDNVSAPPSQNNDGRFYAPTCSSASIAVASMFARAANIFQGIEGLEGYGSELGQEAKKCFDYYFEKHEDEAWELNCDDGTVKSGDADWDKETQITNAIVAAIYLLDLTGDEDYADFVLFNISETELYQNSFIEINSAVSLEAMLHYRSLPNVNPLISDNILDRVRTAHTNDWGNYFRFDKSDLYRAVTPDWTYYWGSNRAVANIGNLNRILIKYNIAPDDEDVMNRKMHNLIHYFHGINPLGICYLSNMYDYGAERSANQIYHSWFSDGTDWDDAQTSLYGPAPGFLAGGPNQGYSGSLTPPGNQPIMKSYLDYNSDYPNVSWEISEPAIYYQAAYVRFIAGLINNDVVTKIDSDRKELTKIKVYPNPAVEEIYIEGSYFNNSISIVDMYGRTLHEGPLQDNLTSVNVSQFPVGIYFINVRDEDGQIVGETKFVKD